jgi:hypothetical protein
MQENALRTFTEFPGLCRISTGYGILPQSITLAVTYLPMKDPLERLSAEDILQHPALQAGISGDDPSSSKTSSRLACYSSYGFSNLLPATSSSLVASTVHDQKDRHSVFKSVTNVKLRDYILKVSTDHELPKSTANRLPPLAPLSPPQEPVSVKKKNKTDQSRPKLKRGISRQGIIPELHQPLPMGTTRPVAFNTRLLNAATHKLTGGSITVLPSLSVLVDFRENQRRSGSKGDYVLLIDSIGNVVGLGFISKMRIYSHYELD